MTTRAASSCPPSGRPARGEARRALLDAALALVRRQGWAATSVDELCAAAGVTKGAFFHHFASKEELGVAATDHWSEWTGAMFAQALYHAADDPLARVMAYLDFRASLTRGTLDQITCFAGTAVQEVYATSDPIRSACQRSIAGHAAALEPDFAAALEAHGVAGIDAHSLAMHTQAVLQGAFVLAKAQGDSAPVIEAVAHLKRYLALFFGMKELAP